jgi:DNA-binding transcriptional ArsR family regulator
VVGSDLVPRQSDRAVAKAAQTSEPIYRLKAEFLRLLGHPARVQILDLLRDGEHTVGRLQAALALDSSGTSQHLTAMRRQGLLESRREGTSVYYRVKDPRIFQLLATARQILTAQLEVTQELLGGLAAETQASDQPRTRRRQPPASG